jgi:hypothetical protein
MDGHVRPGDIEFGVEPLAAPRQCGAANQLGLITQVPAAMIYHTDGAPSEIKLGNLQIVFNWGTRAIGP